MKIKPMHRYIVVEPSEDQEDFRDEDSEFMGFEIPEEFYKTRHEMDRFELVKVVKLGPNVEVDLKEGQTILVETSMLEKHNTPYGNFLWISENYVVAAFEE